MPTAADPSMQLVIISGRSGSGKSSALNLLEDEGFYCIDNLPVSLLPQLTDVRAHLTSRGAEQVYLVARGSSDNAARYAQYLWPVRAGVTVTLDGEDMPFVANEDGSLSSKGDADAMMAVRLKRK